jgi:hypothetical protein
MHRTPKRPPGPWEAISRSTKGRLVRSRHVTRDKAEKRLAGCPRHTAHRLVDRSDEYKAALRQAKAAAETLAAGP